MAKPHTEHETNMFCLNPTHNYNSGSHLRTTIKGAGPRAIYKAVQSSKTKVREQHLQFDVHKIQTVSYHIQTLKKLDSDCQLPKSR